MKDNVQVNVQHRRSNARHLMYNLNTIVDEVEEWYSVTDVFTAE